MDRATDIADRLLAFCESFVSPSGLFFELPMEWGGVASARQDIIKLTMAAGIVVGAFAMEFRVQPTPFQVTAWKGQLPKNVMKRRIDRYMTRNRHSYKTTHSHEVDAIGIGLHALGEL